MYTPYAGAAGMLLNTNGKFTMGKLESSLLSLGFVLNRPSNIGFKSGSITECSPIPIVACYSVLV
jgi:hypothetical protein